MLIQWGRSLTSHIAAPPLAGSHAAAGDARAVTSPAVSTATRKGWGARRGSTATAIGGRMPTYGYGATRRAE